MPSMNDSLTVIKLCKEDKELALSLCDKLDKMILLIGNLKKEKSVKGKNKI